MPKIYSLEHPPQKEKIKEINEEYESRPKLTFNWSLTKERKQLLEMISLDEKIDEDKILKSFSSEDFVEKNSALYLLSELKNISNEKRKNFLFILKQIYENIEKFSPFLDITRPGENKNIKKLIIKSLGNLGDEASPFLKTFEGEENGIEIKKELAEAKINILIENNKEKALPVLEEIYQGDNYFLKLAAIKNLVNFEKEPLKLLEKTIQDNRFSQETKQEIIQTIVEKFVENNKEKAFSILEEMCQNKNWYVRIVAVENLLNFGKNSIPILEKIIKTDDDYSVILKTKKILAAIKNSSNTWMFTSQKSIFSTPDSKKLDKKLTELEKIVKNLKEEFGNNFIGLTIFGSISKGYFDEKESDIDYSLIAKNKIIFERFKQLAHSLNLCHGDYIDVNNLNSDQDLSYLFHGIFLGDFKNLQTLQKNIIKNINEKKWDEIRRKILSNESDIEGSKAISRQHIPKKNIEKTKQFIALLRTPLSYQKISNLINSKNRI